MAEEPAKARWGLRAQQSAALAENTVPDESAGAPEASADAQALASEQPGHYELKREIGRGSQAVVFVAADRHVGRDVAFKQLLRGGPRNAEDRFLREARVAGQLEHPGIAPVYEVGRRADGTLYSAMRLVRGKTLGEVLKAAPTLRARLPLLSHFVQLCHTVAYAHERGVVHRDIKPENVMIGAHGETVLLDWGVAKVRGKDDLSGDKLRAPGIDERFDGTQEGDVVGTPAYMSPEQAMGNLAAVDEQSDVWSLGAVLYELLTGKPPFQHKNAVQLLLAIAKDRIAPVRSLEAEAPRELALICERMLERNKARRYRSARDVAADIEAFRAGGRVAGIEYTRAQLARKWVLRNLPVAIAAGIALVLLLGAGAKIWAENRAARGFLAEALLEKSDAASRDQLWVRAAAYAAAARVQDDTAEARFRAAQDGPLRLEPVWRAELPVGVERVALSPDGRIIAAALADHSIALIEAATAHELRRIEGHDSVVAALAFSPDGAMLATGAEDKQAFVWSTESGDRLAQLAAVRVRDLAFSSDGSRLAVAAGDGSIRIVSADGWTERVRLDGHDGPVTSVAFQPDGDGLLSSGDDGTLRLWSALGAKHPSMKLLRGEGHQPANRAVFVSAVTVASASQDGTVRFFSLEGQQLARINLTHGSIVGLGAPSRGALVALGQDNAVVLIDGGTRAPVARLEGDDSASAVAVSADGASLVAANRDGRLRLWKVIAGARDTRLQLAGEFSGGTALAFSPTGATLALGDASGHISVWDVQRQRVVSGMDLLQGPVSALAFSPDAKFVAVAGHEEQAYLFELSHGDRTTLEGHTDLTTAVAFSPDGALIATGSNDGSVRLWTTPTGAFKRALTAPGMGAVLAVAFSPDGSQLAAAGEDKVIRLFNPANGRLLRKLEGSPEAILALAFSPHGSIVASAGRDQAVRTWRTKNGKLRSTWNGHGGRVWSLSFAPDGETLATASIDGTVRLWDVLTGREEARYERVPEARAVAFSPTGRTLVTTGPKPALQLVELGDKAQQLAPAAELQRQLARGKLRLDGIRLVDDVAALAPAEPPKKRR